MKLYEMWSNKPTNVWLHRLNKDGTPSGSRDARRYYKDKSAAIAHHNHMVDANPNREIAHNLHVNTEIGNFKIKLVGRQSGRATGKTRKATMDELMQYMDNKGSAATAWLKDEKWEELLNLYNSGADIKVMSHLLPKNADAKQWFDKKVEMMKPKGYELFAHEENFDSLDMIFVRS